MTFDGLLILPDRKIKCFIVHHIDIKKIIKKYKFANEILKVTN